MTSPLHSSHSSDKPATLKRTSLYDEHLERGGKFVPFAGWEMPVQFTGVIDEHRAVRERVGIFDVSHMGEIVLHGNEPLSFLQHVTSNDASKLTIGTAQYSLLMHVNGGVVDDIIVYRTAEHEYLLCVNAANIAKDQQYLLEHATGFDVEVVELSHRFAQIAIQGPKAAKTVATFLNTDEAEFTRDVFLPFRFRVVQNDWILARTGYTGEDGFELFLPSESAAVAWSALCESMEEFDGRCCGLAARDTLRLEAAYPLYGHELSDDRNPIAANLKWVVKPQKGEFLGRNALVRAIETGCEQVLAGFEVVDPGVVREGVEICDENQQVVGKVTSGTKTPSLDRPILLAYVDQVALEDRRSLYANVRGRLLAIVKRDLPFYRSQTK